MKDNNHPLVSVIIRSMDRPELAGALKSVADQTYPNIEAVLVNAKGQEYADQGEWCGNFPLRSVGMGHQLPRSRAANLGLEHASGDYLIFLDDDDWFLSHHVQALVQALTNNQDIGAAYAAVQCVWQAKDGSWEQEYLFNQPFDRTRLLVENYIPMHSCLFRAKLLQTGCCFDEGLDTYEDWDFWIQLARHTDFYFFNHIGAMYRIGSESGFGMAGQEDHVDEALRIFFHKWRFKWTEEELAGIVSYAKYHSMYWDVRNLLTAVQEERAQEVHKLESANSALSQAWENLD
ncbi:MAG: glycosyltransferase, partial [Desulfovermiculus sp.]